MAFVAQFDHFIEALPYRTGHLCCNTGAVLGINGTCNLEMWDTVWYVWYSERF